MKSGSDHEESDDHVALPDLNGSDRDDDFYGWDPTLWQHDPAHDETDSAASNDDDLTPNSDPFFANQEEDPEVQQIQFEYDQYIDNLFK